MRIVYFGTPAFAVPSLEALARARHTIAGVVTQPDRPRGRGHRVRPSEVKTAAEGLGAPVFQPTALRTAGFAAELSALTPDLGVVVAYGRILPASVLAIPRLGMINVHASLLPRWRGAAPIHRAVLAGDQETGVTIMRVVEQLDAGPILARMVTPIDVNETSQALERRLAVQGAELLSATVDRLARGPVTEAPQEDALATYAARLEKRESAIDWAQPAVAIHNKIRGLQPWPLASSALGPKRVLFRASRTLSDTARGAAPGTILSADASGIDVATGAGVLRILELQLEGRPPVAAAAFLNGHPLRPGDRFTLIQAGA